MKKTRKRARLAATAVVLCAAVVWATGLIAGPPTTAQPGSDARPDLIVIDSMDRFGALEKPAVAFFHDAHTKAVKEQGKDCSACHITTDGTMSVMYMRTEDEGKDQVMNVYHDNCLGCHREMAGNKQDTGPLECGGCHVKKLPASSWKAIDFDPSLHYSHVKDEKNKCEACHHSYDEKTGKLFYEKGKEDSCLYCHGEKTKGKYIKWEDAAHLSCVNCHKKNIEQKKEAGPIDCRGCHSAHVQKIMAEERPSRAPRYKRDQPDRVILFSGDKNKKAHMDPVPFDHEAHEGYNQSCRACHHSSLDKCTQCHSLEGKKEGGWVNLEQAMHKARANASCVGCHTTAQADAQCAGCHASMQNDARSEASCKVCHMNIPVPSSALATDAGMKLAANAMLAARKKSQGIPKSWDVPETVVLDKMVDKYQAAELPHKKIVDAISKGMAKNKLAEYFHAGQYTMCGGCHHNSPPSKNPPKCASCHVSRLAQATEGAGERPDLMGAYHQQCIACHKTMEIKAVGCTDCHKEKK